MQHIFAVIRAKRCTLIFTYYALAPNRLGHKAMMLSDVCLTSDVCLSVAYIGPKSRTERPRKTKIGTEVAHVTRDSDTTFKVKRSKVKVTRPGRFVHHHVVASGGCSGGRGNVLTVGNCWYVAVCSAAQGASAPTERGEWRRHIVAAARLQLV